MSNALYPMLPGLGYSVIKSPNWATRMQRSVSGRTLRTSDFVNPIWNFTLTYEWLDDGSVWAAPIAGIGPTYVITQQPGPGYLAYYMTPADVTYWLSVGATVVPGNALPAVRPGAALYTIVQGAFGGPSYVGDLTPADVTVWINLGATLTPFVPGSVPPRGKAPATDLRVLMNFFNTRAGAFDDFLLLDPTDNAVTSAVLPRNPADPTGSQFQLARQLAPGGLNEWITAPNQVAAVYLNGLSVNNYTVDPNTGIVAFSAPIGSQVVTADFTYYFRVYFPDSLDFDNFSYQLWQLKQVKLTSVLQDSAPSLCFLSQN